MTTPAQEQAYWDTYAPTYDSNAFTGGIIELLLRELLPGKTLEIGAGQGRLTSRLSARLVWRVYGIDVSPKMLELAQQSNVQYKLCDGRSIPYPDNFFDNIFSVTVFQHIDDLTKLSYIREAQRTLKPDGVLLLQFVEGGHKSDFDHNVSAVSMRGWLEDSGFIVLDTVKAIHHKWKWIKAVKI